MTTYNALITDIQRYFNKGTTATSQLALELPTLINRAERVLGRSVKLLGQAIPVTSNFTTQVPVVAKPDRWRETISMNWNSSGNTRTFLYPRSYEFLRAVFPDDQVLDSPQYYADYDYNNWFIAPTPPASSYFEVLYYQNPAYLTTSNQTNWWAAQAPELLQARVFLEVAKFLEDNEQEQRWSADYQELLAAINNEDMEKVVDRTTVRRSA